MWMILIFEFMISHVGFVIIKYTIIISKLKSANPKFETSSIYLLATEFKSGIEIQKIEDD